MPGWVVVQLRACEQTIPGARDPLAEQSIGRVVRIRTGHINLQRWFALAIRFVLVMTGLPPRAWSPGHRRRPTRRSVAPDRCG